MALQSQQENKFDKDRINLMTIHSAKGLEFDYVFLPRWNEGEIPSYKLDEDDV